MTSTTTDASPIEGLRFVIIGAGMAGILAAIKLREAGFDNFAIYEKADRLGGTWRENTYPGIACDVPSHLYSYSFEPNPNWSHRFSPGAEIQEYFESVAHRHGIVESIHFGQQIARCTFEAGRWTLETVSGLRDEADFVIAATGVLHHPNEPDIAGLDDFRGAQFHSSRWDHTVALAGKRVGIVGTGSTAVQITSAIVDDVAHLSLFQRTAQWIMPQDNPAYTEDEKRDFNDDPEKIQQFRNQLSELFAENFSNAVVDSKSPKMKLIEDMCRSNLDSNVTDAGRHKELLPSYRAACKRLVISPDFYQAIQKPNAELVTEGIDKIEPRGLRTSDGRLHELDILVLATGFRTSDFMRPMTVVGRDGVRLNDVWAKATPAYHSVSIPDFPNYFMLIGPNSPIGNFSLTEIVELQFDYVMQLIDAIRSGECREISATQEATTRFNDDVAEASKNTIWMTGCRSWYLDANGVPASWPWTLKRFRQGMRAPNFADYERI